MMASLFKPTWTHTDPITAKKTKRKAKKWYGQYTDAAGKPCRVPLSANKEAAGTMLADLTKRAEQIKAGVLDETLADNVRRPLSEHVADYVTHLAAKGRCLEHKVESRTHCINEASMRQSPKKW
jgi:hypothetical protein